MVMDNSFFWAPQGATGFGIRNPTVQDPAFRAWPCVRGIRDTAAGASILVLLAGATRRARTHPRPGPDWRRGGGTPQQGSAASGVHASSAAVMIVVAILRGMTPKIPAHNDFHTSAWGSGVRVPLAPPMKPALTPVGAGFTVAGRSPGTVSPSSAPRRASR
ncbi:DUF4267 domain-containing protein [Gordonia sp. DT218]|uniref:DUF4267 domain-containing protein n=1 Tax=Gordonia sp. DT218 TaxID=3416659 RepID=UPI003CEB3626